MTREVGTAPQHLRGRRPVRPFPLVADVGDARPGEARPADADAVAQRPMIGQHEIKPPLAGADDDRPGASPPSNGTVSRGMGVATGCSRESSALAKTCPFRRRKRPAQTAARIRLRRSYSPMETIDNGPAHPIRRGRVIIAGKRRHAMNCARRRMTNSSIASNCGEEDTIEAMSQRTYQRAGAPFSARAGPTCLTLPSRLDAPVPFPNNAAGLSRTREEMRNRPRR